MKITPFGLILIGTFLIPMSLSAQSKSLTFPLKTVIDTTANPFNYIQPEKNDTRVTLPQIEMRYHTLSRSLHLGLLDKTLLIIIGKDKSGVNFIVFDKNDNKDFSDEKLIYFKDTLTSPTRGNYKHFSSKMIVNQKTVLLDFDYSIIKPKALNITFEDSSENKIHFMVRPNTYKYAEIKYGETITPVVVFTRSVYDYSRKSTFLISGSPVFGMDSLKSLLATGASRYFPGDISLLGKKMFLFDKITPLGDSIVVIPKEDSSGTYGTKVGFLARNFDKSDILSGKPLALAGMKGKYVLLDFWGTWCAPCIQIMNDIKNVHQDLDANKMAMIGVCYDDNISKVEKFIRQKSIDWEQIFDKRSDSAMVRLFDISSFPSFILIDPEGKIVFRDEGINGFQRLKSQLPALLRY